MSQLNINPFASGCDCRHDLDHLTPVERKARLRYEHWQRVLSVIVTILGITAVVGAFLLASPYTKLGEFQIILPMATFMYVWGMPFAVFSALTKLIFWYSNRNESFQRPCHYNTPGDDDDE